MARKGIPNKVCYLIAVPVLFVQRKILATYCLLLFVKWGVRKGWVLQTLNFIIIINETEIANNPQSSILWYQLRINDIYNPIFYKCIVWSYVQSRIYDINKISSKSQDQCRQNQISKYGYRRISTTKQGINLKFHLYRLSIYASRKKNFNDVCWNQQQFADSCQHIPAFYSPDIVVT